MDDSDRSELSGKTKCWDEKVEAWKPSLLGTVGLRRWCARSTGKSQKNFNKRDEEK